MVCVFLPHYLIIDNTQSNCKSIFCFITGPCTSLSFWVPGIVALWVKALPDNIRFPDPDPVCLAQGHPARALLSAVLVLCKAAKWVMVDVVV